MDREIGALPYRIRNNLVEIVLITTRGGKNWIFPKGQVEKRYTSQEVAEIEAFEEAGVLGKIKADNVRDFLIRRGNRKIRLTIYPIQFDKVLGEWPEALERQRIVIAFDEALKMIKHKELRRCVRLMLRDVA